MIHQITEINFPEYATLSSAVVTLAEMGDRFISTQVKIDGDIVPSFVDWELVFRGERFVLDIKEPQAVKDNTTRNSIIDLTFYSWPVLQLKRYFMFETTQTAAGTIMADKYNASVSLNIRDFCDLLNRVLEYYFGGKIYVDFNTAVSIIETATLEINYTYIWDAIQKLYEAYGVRWRIIYDENTNTYAIRVGYSQPVIDDHDFEYGYDGGLMRFERQVQDSDIKNILLGRGGTQNVPYRYFKGTDPHNPGWAADPDAIPELSNVYFDRIYDANFRRYIQGWRTNPNCALSVKDIYDAERGVYDWSYQKGHTDDTFDPVEYVKDDLSIAKYGEKWGALDDNDDIYPTIQGIILGGGRIDTVIDVSPITNDDINQASSNASLKISIDGVKSQVDTIQGNSLVTKTIRGAQFSVPSGIIADVFNNGFFASAEFANRASQIRISVETPQCSIDIYDATTGNKVNPQGLTEGKYFYTITVAIRNSGSRAVENVTYGVNGLYLLQANPGSGEAWKPTFDIYVRNIFDSQQGPNESDTDYSLRVWREVLGDRLGNEAKVVFSDGFMSISEDYEFTIASYPAVDRSKSLNGLQSEWRITLYKSDAEFDATGYYIPNSKTGGSPVAGDHFFFIGIDMPHFYVTEAEKRLNEFKTGSLDNLSEVNPTWVISLDKVRLDDEYNDAMERLFDKMDSGVELHIRDRRFAPIPLALYANSVTFTWQDDTIILPVVEVVLTDKPIVVKNTVQTIQNDINILKSAVAQSGNVEGIVRQVTRPMFLGKGGDEQTSLSPTRFASLVSSKDFEQGDIGGQGWGFYRDDHIDYQEEESDGAKGDPSKSGDSDDNKTALKSSNLSVLEIDKLIVRREMSVNDIVVNQITYMGGKQIISAASIECVQVVERNDSYDCYFDQKQGSVKNLFRVGDIAMGQIFSADNIQLKFYKCVVIGIGQDHIRLSKTMKHGEGAPGKGDVIVQFGSVDDTNRQYAIIRDVIGGGYEKMLSGLYSPYSEGTQYYFAGINEVKKKPFFFVGNSYSSVCFDAADGLFRLKGNIVQSPGGTEFPVSCFCGDYVQNRSYYYGDEVVYEGESWLHIGQAVTNGVAPGTDAAVWQKKAAKGSDGKSAYKSIVFKRSETKPNKPGSNIGSYSNPVPTGWSDGIPAPAAGQTSDTCVWVTSRIFTADGQPPQEDAWSAVQQLTDTSDIDFEFSAVEDSPGTPTTTPANWHDTATADDIWMAVRKGENGVWGTWEVTKIKGEKGDPGVSVVAQYSANGTTGWHATFAAGDLYMRTSADGGQTWGEAIRIVGEDGGPGADGKPGDYTDYSFAYSPNLTSSQADGCPTDTGTDGSEGSKITSWSDAPPAAVSGQYLWIRVVGMTYDPENPSADATGFVRGTPSYARIGGEKGKDGTDGIDGKKGKILRGRSQWYNTGYNNNPSVPYQGELDTTGEYIDIVLYRGFTYLCKIGGNNAIASDPETNAHGCWERMNNFESIATEAIWAERARFVNINVDDLYVKELHTYGDQINISGNVASFKSGDNPSVFAKIEGSPLTDSGGGTSFSRTITQKSGNVTDEVNPAEISILSQSVAGERIDIQNGNNVVSVPQMRITVSKTNTQLNPGLTASIELVFISSSGQRFILYAHSVDELANSSHTFVVPPKNVSLPIGTWGIATYASVLLEKNESATVIVAPNNSTLSVEIKPTEDTTQLASDGFRTIWGGGEGFKATSAGAKVLQGGNEYTALAGDGGLKRIELVRSASYPTPEEDGVLYIKIS